MQVDGVEGDFAGELQPRHDHARHPEEEDVVAGFHDRGRVEVLQVGGLFGPAQGGERPQAGGEPGVEHIGVLLQIGAAAVGAVRGVLAGDGLLAAVGAVPDRDAVSPPELARDAPVLDVLQPVVVDLGEALGHDADAPVAHGRQGGVGQRLDAHEPLRGDHRLDDLAAALRARHGQLVGLFAEHQPGGAHIFPELLAAFEAVQAGVGPAVGVDARRFVQHGDDRQAVALADLEVVRVVPGRDLERPGAELAVDVFIGDDRDGAVEHRARSPGAR